MTIEALGVFALVDRYRLEVEDLKDRQNNADDVNE